MSIDSNLYLCLELFHKKQLTILLGLGKSILSNTYGIIDNSDDNGILPAPVETNIILPLPLSTLETG